MDDEDYYSRRQRKADNEFVMFLRYCVVLPLGLILLVSLVRWFIIFL
jgi:hypothetical protein